jgi:hypothetical protein
MADLQHGFIGHESAHEQLRQQSQRSPAFGHHRDQFRLRCIEGQLARVVLLEQREDGRRQQLGELVVALMDG